MPTSRPTNEFYKEILDHMLEGCQILDFDWRYLYINHTATVHNRRPSCELLGNRYMDMWPGIEETEVYRLIELCMKERTSQAMENEFTFPDKSKGWFELRISPIPEGVFIMSIDITKRKNFESELKTMVQVLELLNSSGSQEEILKAILPCIQDFLQCQAAAIRLRVGDDFPYLATSGFSEDFVEKEKYLCSRDCEGNVLRDDSGKPLLECMCGNIILGRYDVSKNFFTSDGCFWSNCTSELLATTTDSDRMARTRNRCNSEGYESVALIPLRTGQETYGLIQLNDKRQQYFTASSIAQMRRIADHIAAYLSKKQALEDLRQSENKFSVMAETINDIFWLATWKLDKIVYVSPAYEKLWGMSCESLYQVPSSFLDTIHPDDRAGVSEIIERFHFRGLAFECEFRIVPQNADIRWIRVRGFPVRSELAKERLMTGLCIDITANKKAESDKLKLAEQFQQSQKLESIGRLAGGVAHDFNNMLAVQLGYCDIILEKLNAADPIAKNILQVRACTERAATLTRQLLAFSRKQALQPVVLDLNAVIVDIEKMLGRLIGEDIDIATILSKDLMKVRVDPGQIEQVIMNLAVNSRDAMPKGGKLTIETANAYMDETYIKRHADTTVGPHVMLAVTDTGCGMNDEIKSKLFEPFFTTKSKGKGTGLELATVYGIVQQSGGNIWVYSEVGHGTTFKIYFPAVEAPLSETVRKSTTHEYGNGELILIVEDEVSLRNLFAEMIESIGYRVVSAGNGGEALLAVEEGNLKPDLLITDVVMPGMGGKTLAERLSRSNPNLGVLYMSGYTENSIVHNGALDTGIHFLQKPFNKKEIADKIRELLSITAQLR
ncbi:MAG: two-component system, cell cycle sensor histidine kinase and response regulator CckA [Clostridiales bacterium]|jgi:PAS domain S-box-containing protein|nr:two-component system, cell cycle sensor histidine kinase and response regulator CckA [Clostridiales bacterium]MDN5283018.1 two-component system, cell cycle sensor histidine kinase and response regulator CckA [Candidatus Ozemobacter sp.]